MASASPSGRQALFFVLPFLPDHPGRHPFTLDTKRSTMRFAKSNDVLGTTNRGNPAESSLCTLCRADCMGQCETWKSSLVGRKLL